MPAAGSGTTERPTGYRDQRWATPAEQPATEPRTTTTPTAACRRARRFLAEVHDAIRQSPQWDRTVMVVNFDEHGGFCRRLYQYGS